MQSTPDHDRRVHHAVPGGSTALITVVIADDQRMVRGGLRVILESERRTSPVVGEAGDGELEAIENSCTGTPPDIALLDIRMPNLDGLQAARRHSWWSPLRPRVLMSHVSFENADEYVFEALRVGASGFLLKDAPPEQLVGAVRSIAAGDALIDPSVTRRLITRFARAARPAAELPDPLKDLTPREARRVLQTEHRADLSNIEIASRARRRGKHRQDPRRSHPHQARTPRPGTSCRPRLRKRLRRP